MQMKKRFLVTLLAVALVIAALTIPASALNSTMTYKRDSGTIETGSLTTTWDISLGASISQAVAIVTTSKSIVVYANVDATVIANRNIYHNTNVDIISGTKATALVNNVINDIGIGEIQSATATYGVGPTSLGPLTVS